MTGSSLVLLLIAVFALAACGRPDGDVGARLSGGRVDGGGVSVGLDFNVCPRLDVSVAYPHELEVGAVAMLTATADDPDGEELSFRWRASSGSFSEPSEPVTTYECDEPGRQDLSVTATDDEDCPTVREFEVDCFDE